MAATLERRGSRHRHATEETARYEICELVRPRAGGGVVRVLATSETRDGALLTLRTIAREAGPDIGPIAIWDTATRMWLAH